MDKMLDPKTKKIYKTSYSLCQIWIMIYAKFTLGGG